MGYEGPVAKRPSAALFPRSLVRRTNKVRLRAHLGMPCIWSFCGGPIKRFYRLWVLLFALAGLVSAAEGQLIPIPSPAGYVNDVAGIISASDRNAIANLIESLEQKTTAQIAVVTLKTTRPESVQQYSVRLFDQWKIGQKGKDNGVLLLVAVEDREAWITTGYGLEGALPDVIASKIVRDIMVPFFKEGQYSEGIRQGVIAVVSLVAKEYNVQVSGKEAQIYGQLQGSDAETPWIFILVFAVLVLIALSSLFRSDARYDQRGGGYYEGWHGGGSGGFGGGFGGFGGGMTAGGGGGGRW